MCHHGLCIYPLLISLASTKSESIPPSVCVTKAKQKHTHSLSWLVTNIDTSMKTYSFRLKRSLFKPFTNHDFIGKTLTVENNVKQNSQACHVRRQNSTEHVCRVTGLRNDHLNYWRVFLLQTPKYLNLKGKEKKCFQNNFALFGSNLISLPSAFILSCTSHAYISTVCRF